MHSHDMYQGSEGMAFVLQRIYNLPKETREITSAKMTKKHLLRQCERHLQSASDEQGQKEQSWRQKGRDERGRGSDNTAGLQKGRVEEGKISFEKHRNRKTQEYASMISSQPALYIFTYTWVFSLSHGSTFVFVKTPD